MSKYIGRRRDLKRSSYLELESDVTLDRLITEFAFPEEMDASFLEAVQRFLDHRFDLLGSGWVQCAYGMHAPGIDGICFRPEGPIAIDAAGAWLAGRVNLANLNHSQMIWAVIDPAYMPLDWQIDLRSGYRWSATRWSQDISTLGPKGSDIKLPWELARLQHLPQLAFAYGAKPQRNTTINKGRLLYEFRNQVLDFIATNPPRFGVNWVCTMDVAIRLCNMLLARELFLCAGADLDPDFETAFARSVYEHGEFIATHLEYSGVVRGNHYLTNIVGLLFAGASLPSDARTDAWLAFGVQELNNEAVAQFNPDGGNFEGSTSYHRLSLQLLVYGAAVIQGLSKKRYRRVLVVDPRSWSGPPNLESQQNRYDGSLLASETLGRIVLAGKFAELLTGPDQRAPQIGDNDSGFLFRLQPPYRSVDAKTYRKQWLDAHNSTDEPVITDDHTDHRHVLDAVHGLTSRQAGSAPESMLVRAIAGTYIDIDVCDSRAEQKGSEHDWEKLMTLSNSSGWSRESREFDLPDGFSVEEVALHAFPDSGFYLMKGSGLYILVRCGSIGQNGIGGHDHNDQLSMVLTIGETPVIIDPGTWVYTALPDMRNQYRSVKAHFAPRIADEEPAGLSRGLFQLDDPKPGACLYFGPRGFVGMHAGFSSPVYRQISLCSDRLRVTDFSPTKNLRPLDIPCIPWAARYGARLKRGAYL